MKNTVAIILARGGSKGIPKKNIIDFCGKPLLAWSIIQAINVKEISKVWVSSDNDEFLKIARKYGAGTIKRPKHIATSTSSPVLGWLHAIQHIEKIGKNVDGVVALQPTSPVRESLDISKGIKKFYRSKYDSIFSAETVFVTAHNSVSLGSRFAASAASRILSWIVRNFIETSVLLFIVFGKIFCNPAFTKP